MTTPVHHQFSLSVLSSSKFFERFLCPRKCKKMEIDFNNVKFFDDIFYFFGFWQNVVLNDEPGRNSSSWGVYHSNLLYFNSHACGMALIRHLIFNRILCQILGTKSLRVKMVIPIFKTFTTFVLFRFCMENRWAEKKNDFSQAEFGISPKNRIQAAVKT